MKNNFVTNEFLKFDSLTILCEEVDELKNILKKYFITPKHLVINLALFTNPSDDFLDLINFLATLLKSSSFSLQVFAVSQNLINKLQGHRFRNILVISDLAKYIELLDNIGREFKVTSLLKSYVDETMKHFFNTSGLIVRRSELSIEKNPTSFLNEMNYFQTFELENGFFSFVIGSKEEAFVALLKSFGQEQLAPIFSQITAKIPEEFLKNVRLHNYLAHPYDKFPTDKILHKDQRYSFFEGSNVMRIPLSCEIGEFFLEVWIPNKFAKEVLKFLNP